MKPIAAIARKSNAITIGECRARYSDDGESPLICGELP